MENISKLWYKIRYLIEYPILNFINLFVKTDDKYIAFGSWLGKNYTDNPRYLFEYILKENKGYKLIWIGNLEIKNQVPVHDDVLFVKIHSLKSIYYIMKSKYLVFCQDIRDIYPVNFYKSKTKIYLDHGIPVKKWGLDVIDAGKELSFLPKVKKDIQNMYLFMTGGDVQYDYFISSSDLHLECISSAMENFGAKKENILKSGTPRNDFLFENKDKDNFKIKKKYADLLNFDSSKRVVLYVPAYRRSNAKIESFSERNKEDSDKLKKILNKNNAVLIEKNHFRTYTQNDIKENRDKDNVIIKLSEMNTINIQEMLLFTDVLITDYSGVFFDFAVLDKPIIHYAFDYDFYKYEDTGLYYDIEDFSAGEVTKTFKETCSEIENILGGNDNYKSKREYVRNKYLEYENGNASEIIFNTTIKDN